MLIAKYKNVALAKNGELLKLHYDKVLENNSWAEIKEAIDLGYLDTFHLGWYGQTKNFIGTDGITYTMRLVDTKEGRYKRVSDGKLNKVVFELEYTLANTSNLATPSSTSPSIFSDTALYQRLNTGDIWDILPSDLQAIIEPYYIKSASAHSSAGYQNCDDLSSKLFLPSMSEIILTAGQTYFNYQLESESYKDGSLLGCFEYNETFEHRHKTIVTNKTTPAQYLTRSPDSDVNNWWWTWSGSGNSGAITGIAWSEYKYVAFCFAL